MDVMVGWLCGQTVDSLLHCDIKYIFTYSIIL